MIPIIEFFKGRLAFKLFAIVSIPLVLGLVAWTAFTILYSSQYINAAALAIGADPAHASEDLASFTRNTIVFAAAILLLTSGAIILMVLKVVNRPVNALMQATRRFERGNYLAGADVSQNDELGRLAVAIGRMGREIYAKQRELNRQRDEYQQLFETVPCIITVQDRRFRLIGYNREFSRQFDPKSGDYCYHAYKGRSSKCPDCPVARTFEDGRTHHSEEMGVDKDGTVRHWLVRTAPLTDDAGNVVAAMEMSLDISGIRRLQKQLEQTEKIYFAIFNNIPNAVFVLDRNTLEITDCNDAARKIYGYEKSELVGSSFLTLFCDDERERVKSLILSVPIINRVRQTAKDRRRLFADIRISSGKFPGGEVLLVTASDITARLAAEQQLIHAGKMATLGEMATGVAHELNQPLTVIKSASSFIVRKINNAKHENITPDMDMLADMAAEIDTHVDRASRIINHMREFGRKPEMDLSPVDLNLVMTRAHEFFRRQLELRNISVEWSLQEDLPPILGDAGRLEQVFINLLINARDAIDERFAAKPPDEKARRVIGLSTELADGRVLAQVRDTGKGIPPDVMDRLFEPFFTTKKVGEGTGLGLSITYGIVKDCGGEIRAANSTQGGAVFTLSFPARKALES
jgi:histidine kinase